MGKRRRAAGSSSGLHLLIYPSNLVNASRMGKIASSLHSVTGFRESHLVGVAEKGLAGEESLADSVKVVRLAGSARRGSLGQLLRFAFWQPRVFWRYRGADIDVVAAHNIWVLPMCWLLARWTGAGLAYNCHELETETAAMSGLKQRVARWIEASFITRCDVVSVVNEPIADWYQDRYGIARPTVLGNVPTVRDAEVGLRQKLGIRHDEMLYIHTGHLVEGRNIPLIVEAFSASHHHVVFLGDGHLRPSILEAGTNSPNIHWLPPVEPDLIVAHVREADVGLCLIDLGISLSDRLSSPNKLLETLAAHNPPLCSDLTEARRLLGPLADEWILDDVQNDLGDAIARISKRDVETFRAGWRGRISWDADVAALVRSYARITPRSEQTTRRLETGR